MIELRVKDVDVVLVKQLLESFNVKAIISSGRIIFDNAELEKENFLKRFCSYVTVLGIQNYCEDLKYQNLILNSNIVEEYDLIYPEVKRGQVYWCDFGIPYRGEVGYIRPAIIIQNDAISIRGQTVQVVPCTTTYRTEKPWRPSFQFSQENMTDFYLTNNKEGYLMTDKIRDVDKTRLRGYIGTMTEEFMTFVEEYISKTMALKKKVVYQEVPKVVYLNQEKSARRKTTGNVNIKQIQLLARVDISQLIKVSKSHAYTEAKAEQILKTFGFDMEKKGNKLLLKAILISLKIEDYDMETLCYKISKEESEISKNEIKRLVVARVKEQFKFQKSPTIDFIRLVETLITQGGFAE